MENDERSNNSASPLNPSLKKKTLSTKSEPKTEKKEAELSKSKSTKSKVTSPERRNREIADMSSYVSGDELNESQFQII